jgi:hypothetical protein
MGFTFQVERAWSLESAGVYHLIGYLLNGTVLPGARAHIRGIAGCEVKVKSVVIVPKVPALRQDNQLTISIERPTFELTSVEGKELVQE